jgi:hypothetical protein
METFEFYERMKPHIERAASVAMKRARRISMNAHFLMQVYRMERDRLHFKTWELKKSETTEPDRFNGAMTREEFEEHLIGLGVWVEEFGEEPEDGFIHKL